MNGFGLLLLSLVLVTPVEAAEATGGGAWTIGPNFGFSVVSASGGGGSIVALGWPSGGGLFLGGVQPGLRVGYVTPAGGSDIYLDTGVNYASSAGSSVYSVMNTVNFQVNFARRSDITPYVTAGAGFALTGFSDYSETHALFGLGVGMRRMVSDGHGAVRSEFRFDRLGGSNRESGLNSFAVKIGVDLWIR